MKKPSTMTEDYLRRRISHWLWTMKHWPDDKELKQIGRYIVERYRRELERRGLTN